MQKNNQTVENIAIIMVLLAMPFFVYSVSDPSNYKYSIITFILVFGSDILLYINN